VTALRILGTLWALPHTIIGLLMMLIPCWKDSVSNVKSRWVWFPLVPRAVRVHNWTVHFVAGLIVPPGMRGGFRTGAQTHGSCIWFADKRQWDRPELVRHEERHNRQEWVFGPFYMLLYLGSFLVNLARFDGDSLKAYREIPFEKDAREHEHE